MTTTTRTRTLIPPVSPEITFTATLVEMLDECTLRIGDHLETATPTTFREAAASAVYWHRYLRVAPQTGDRRLPMSREDQTYVARLQHADGSRQVWEGGWEVVHSGPDHQVLVSTADGVRIRASSSDVRQQEGRTLVCFPTERRFASPGFYLTIGLAGPAARNPVRWYVNAEAADTPHLFEHVIARLDSEELPFTIKTLNTPEAHPRPDATVLYGDRQHANRFLAALRAATEGKTLRTGTPAFTRVVGPGLGVADEPPWQENPTSFGQHRSRLVVDGVIAAGPGADLAARTHAIIQAFTEAGIDPAQPHLSPGSTDLDLDQP